MTIELTTALARQATTIPNKCHSLLSPSYFIPFTGLPCIIIMMTERGTFGRTSCDDNLSFHLALTVATTTTTPTAPPTTTVVCLSF